MTAFSWPISVIPLMRFFFMDIFKFLLMQIEWAVAAGL